MAVKDGGAMVIVKVGCSSHGNQDQCRLDRKIKAEHDSNTITNQKNFVIFIISSLNMVWLYRDCDRLG